MKRFGWTVSVMGLVVGWTGLAEAQSWINPGSGSWFEKTNWSSGAVPVAGQNPVIANGGTAMIEAPGATADVIIIGNNGSGNLIVTAGGTAVPVYDIRIAQQFATDIGVVTVAGGSVTCRWMQVAKAGQGTLALNAGTVRAVGPSPSVRMGEGSGIGNLHIGGGSFEAANGMRLGYAANSTTHVLVSGGLLKLDTGTLELAYSQNTTSSVVQVGGTVDVPMLYMNWDAASPGYAEIHLGGGTNLVGTDLNNVWGRAKIGVTNGLLRVSRDFYLANGASSSGEFELSGGAVEVGREWYLALGSDTTNQVVLSGGMLRVGGITCMARNERSYAEVTLTNSACVALMGEVRVGERLGGTAVLSLDGGVLAATNDVVSIGHYGRGTLNMTAGILKAREIQVGRYSGATGVVNLCGGLLQAETVTRSSAASGTFSFTGGTLAVDTYTGILGALVNGGGTVAPGGEGLGTTVVGHNYTETTTQGGIHVQLGGTERGTQYDWLSVPAGTVTLKGNLTATLADGFAESIVPDDTFYVVESPNAIQGTFNNVASGGRLKVPGGGSFRVYYGTGSDLPNKVTLTGYMHDGTVISIR